MCDKIMSDCLQEQCSVSRLSLTRSFKITLSDGSYITVSPQDYSVKYIKFYGDYSELQEIIEKIVNCLKNNIELFEEHL